MRNAAVVLYSSKTITKETMQMAPSPGRSPPNPRLGAPSELGCSHTRRLLDLIGGGLTLPSEGNASKEAPPALLKVETACAFGNEKILKARMRERARRGSPHCCGASRLSLVTQIS